MITSCGESALLASGLLLLGSVSVSHLSRPSACYILCWSMDGLVSVTAFASETEHSWLEQSDGGSKFSKKIQGAVLFHCMVKTSQIYIKV